MDTVEMNCADALVLQSADPETTEKIGAVLADILPPGAVLALFGDLATGKTCLVRGVSRALVGDEPVHSPTFTLVNQYGVPPALYHLDLYRISGAEELADLGYEELFDGGSVCAIEWAERAEGALPPRRMEIHLSHAGDDLRLLRLENHALLESGWRQYFSEFLILE